MGVLRQRREVSVFRQSDGFTHLIFVSRRRNTWLLLFVSLEMSCLLISGEEALSDADHVPQRH